MDETDSEVTHPVTAAPPPAAVPPPRVERRGGLLATVLALLALILAGFTLWRVVAIERGQGAADAAMRDALGTRIDALSRDVDQRKRDVDAFRARLADADGVNKSVREELLGLGERSRHLEDAVANLAEQRLTGRDALALNEAEFLLQLADERLALFHDAQAAIGAYKLADSALAAAEDPVFAGVRQTIGAEMQALQAAKPLETSATLSALEKMRGGLATLPSKSRNEASAAPPSRLAALLGQFVRVSSDATALPGSRDPELARALVAIDLRAAQAALIARDPAAYTGALARAKDALAADFDAGAQPVKDDLAEIDRLAAAPLAPALPELGSALRELRNLRATRALAQPRAVAPVAAPANGAGP